MPPESLPDALVLGDSHSNALHEGCLAHGLKTEMIRFSGNFWHQRRVMLHPEHGVWIKNAAALQAQVHEVRARLGVRSLLTPDVPVIGSLGFHLGRFVPSVGTRGHVSSRAHFVEDPAALHMSSAFVEEYAALARAIHIRMARRIDRQTRLVIVAPPLAQDRPNMRAFFDAILNRMRAFGLTVYDPNADLKTSGRALHPSYLAEDGTHGNAKYGAEVIGNLLSKGLIQRAA